jgi:hypothetical protein
VLVVPDASEQRDPFESSGTASPATQNHIPGDLNRLLGLHISLYDKHLTVYNFGL